MSGFCLLIKSANPQDKAFDNITYDNLISSMTLSKLNFAEVSQYKYQTSLSPPYTMDTISGNVEIGKLTLGKGNLALCNLVLSNLTFNNVMIGTSKLSSQSITAYRFPKILLGSLSFRNLTFGNPTIANFIGNIPVFGNRTLGDILKNFITGSLDLDDIVLFNSTLINGADSLPNGFPFPAKPTNSSVNNDTLQQSGGNLTNLIYLAINRISPPSNLADYIAVVLESKFFNGGALLITLLFLIAMAYPLFRLSKKRSVLVLVFSKTVVSVFAMILRLCSFFFLPFLPINYFTIMYITEVLYIIQILAIELHLLALATNRTLAVFFPIWYSSNVRGKFLWKLCIGIWIFAIVSNTIFAFLISHKFLIYKYLSSICVCFSAFLYLLMSAKLIYLKCAKRDISNQSELDHVKISVICMFGMIPFLVENLPEIINGTEFYAANFGWFYLSSTFSSYFTYITEDLCLLLLCKDFRRMFIPICCFCFPKPANAVGINGNVVVPAPQMVGK